MASRASKRAIIKRYFDFEDDDKARCKICTHALRSNRSFNLKIHIMKVHNIKEDELYKTQKINSGAGVSKVPKKVIRKNSIKVELNKKKFFLAYVGLVTEDNFPIDLLDSQNFKNLIDPISRGLSEKLEKRFYVNSKNCKKVLQLVSNKIRGGIKKYLHQHLLSLKITELPQNILGISVQFLKTGEIQTLVLGTVDMKNSHESSTKNLETDILNILALYNLNLNQMVSVTSENGPSLIRGTKISDDEQENQDMGEENQAYLRKVQLFENTLQLNLGDIQISRCLAHTAQLCVLDALKDAEIKKIVFTCRDFVEFIREPSNTCLQIFEENKLDVPQLDCPMKLGSTYSMIKGLKTARDTLRGREVDKEKSLDEYFELIDNSWKYIEAYCIAFEPLHMIIAKVQEEQLHYGNFYAEWLKCKLCTEKILEKTSNPIIKKVSKVLVQCMGNRTKELLNNEGLLGCLYLDPRFNHTLRMEKKLQACTYLKALYDKLNNLKTLSNQIKVEPISISELENAEFSQEAEFSRASKFSQDADDYLNEYLTRSLAPSADEGNVYTKIENLQLSFLRANSNVLQFWRDKQYAEWELYILSKICFAIPANHIFDAAFTSLNHISAVNNNVNLDIRENILLVKLNRTYLEQAVDKIQLFEDEN